MSQVIQFPSCLSLPRADWNRLYDRRMADRLGKSDIEMNGFGSLADDAYNDGEHPETAADEELSCWRY